VKPLLISTPASEELQEAVRWYEERRPGWGVKLFDGVVHTLDLIVAHPEIGEPRGGRPPSRRLRVLGFPYYVAYRDREYDIYVVAVAHTGRRPGYWKHRS
jgi:toxin ParE1/3/4